MVSLLFHIIIRFVKTEKFLISKTSCGYVLSLHSVRFLSKNYKILACVAFSVHV